MKAKFSIVAILLLATIFSFSQQYPNLSFSPAQPKPGDKIHFEYSPAGTVLGNETSFDAVAYINDGTVRAQEVKLKADRDKWSGEIMTNDSTKAVFIAFKKDELIDNNKEQGYSLLLYTNGAPVKGAYIACADFNSSYGSYLIQIKNDPAQALELYNKEFDRYPELKLKYLVSYLNALMRVDKATANEIIQPLVDELAAKKNKTESDYQTLIMVSGRMGGKEASDKWEAEAIKSFPKGSYAREKKLNAFYTEKDIKKKEILLNAFLKNNPVKNENDKKINNGLYNTMAAAALAKKDWPLYKKYTARIKDKQMLANSYNSAAWALSGESLDAKVSKANLLTAKDFSSKAVAYAKTFSENPEDKPTYYTEKEFRNNMKYTIGSYQDTYGLVLWKSGLQNEAFKVQEDAIKNMGDGDNEANERYIIYKEKVKGIRSVKDEIENFVKSGKASATLKEILKKAYIAEGNPEAEYTSYMDNLMKAYREKLKEEVLKKMISKEAPQFALKDLSGNSVTLEELKGKVVIVDFWATWCGPCKASFPAMQTALNKYKDDPNVKFVFIDSWENKKPEEMHTNAEEFIKTNKYTFRVLLDTDDKVIGSYAVEGIPTKFVIDPPGKIRFTSIGYDGSADKLVDELSAVIDILKPVALNGSQKAF